MARQNAAAIEARMQAQGERLSIAAEAFNGARYRRQLLEGRTVKAKAAEVQAQKRLAVLRQRLDSRARLLYMHPGAPYAAFLNMRSLSDSGRQRVLSDAVLTADSDLVSATDRARRQVMAEARKLSALREQAQQTEEVLAARRADAGAQLSSQRAFLATVKGDIARMIAADRQRQLTAARHGTVTGRRNVVIDESAIPPPPPPKAGASKALAVARAQIGKPYLWGAAGPDKFDCSGLTMYAWATVGVQLVHFAASQYDMLPKVRRNALQPGDLVFFGNPIHHEGIYEGGGIMIDAPETGEFVRRDSIYRADYAGASRP
jgi:cell wall-associated NlpC family hydrolase